jgi:adenylate kinase
VRKFFNVEIHNQNKTNLMLDWFYTKMRPCVDDLMRVIFYLHKQEKLDKVQSEHIVSKFKEINLQLHGLIDSLT